MESAIRMAETDDEWALLDAVVNNNIAEVTRLLEKGVCPNIHDDSVGNSAFVFVSNAFVFWVCSSRLEVV